MKRRKFLHTSLNGLLIPTALASSSALLTQGCGLTRLFQKNPDFSRLKGFNLLEKFTAHNPRQKYRESDFEIIAEWGMNFVRLPMSYWNWASTDDWFNIDENVFLDIDEAVRLGRQYGIHVNINLHRIPGYCINNRQMEPFDLFEDTDANMEKALNAARYHWKYIAERYKDVPNRHLSFDLINEPPFMDDHTRYIQVVKSLVEGIREVSPHRLIVADGIDVGRTPVPGLKDMDLVQSCRGYDPIYVSHYKASWMPQHLVNQEEPPEWPVQIGDTLWDRHMLKEKLIDPWKPLMQEGVQVHVGEWGVYNKTPHDVALAYMEDLLTIWDEVSWGNAMWNLRGAFGPLDSGRDDVSYENYKGHKLDRKMLELLQKYNEARS